jgi:hypothetical protein
LAGERAEGGMLQAKELFWLPWGELRTVPGLAVRCRLCQVRLLEVRVLFLCRRKKRMFPATLRLCKLLTAPAQGTYSK